MTKVLEINKITKISFLMILLILSIGAVSAADISADNMTADTDVDLMLDDSPARVSSVNVNANNYADLKDYCKKTDVNYVINLTGSQYVINDKITIANSVTIIGSPNNYITGNYNNVVFQCTKTALTLNFINITFKDISCNMLMRDQSNACNFVNCTFDNIATGSGQTSVVYNQQGTMRFDGCNFTNCRTSYGAITNHNFNVNAVRMSVNNCNFINNTATTEPGAINNCGILNVTASNFINNNATWWAGAIHTHYNAKTRIVGSNFIGNYAGWNGGALYTYSKLEIYNSTFKWNNCSTNNGGGAIGAYDYGSSYNLTVENCWFEDNNNLCVPNGRGGAISVSNGGKLNVHGSTFINNNADIGQAICSSIIQDENSTNATPNLQIYNNTFINHTGSSNTVEIQNGTYLFENNVFINSVQNIPQQNTAGNIPLLMASAALVTSNEDSEDTPTVIYQKNGTYNSIYYHEGENLILIGESRDGVIFKEMEINPDGQTGKFGNYTFINMTIKENGKYPLELPLNSNVKFINCTFINVFFNLNSDIAFQFNVEYKSFGNGVSNIGPYDFQNASYSFINCHFYFENGTDQPEVWSGNPAYYGDSIKAVIFSDCLATLNIIDCTFENIVSADDIIYMMLIQRRGDERINIVNPTIIDCTYNTFVNAEIPGLDSDDNGVVSITYRPEMGVSVEDSFAGDVNPVTIALPANATGEVTVTVNNKKYSATLENGAATIVTDGLDAGEYTAVVDYAGDEYYAPTTKTAVFNVNPKIQTAITPVSGDATVKYGDSHSVQLTANGNVILPNQQVTITFSKDGEVVATKQATTDKFGIATYNHDLPAGVYDVSARFEEAEINGLKHGAAEANFTTTVEHIKPVIVGNDMTLVTKVGNKFTVLLKDENGKLLTNQKVNFTICLEGSKAPKTYTLTTDENGIAGLSINLMMGKWKMDISIDTPGYEKTNQTYTLTSVRNEAKIISQSTEIKTKGQLFKVKLVDQAGQALAGQKVIIHVGTKGYERTTDANGEASLPINLANGKLYNFFLSFAGTSLYTPCTGGTQITTNYQE